ncbi:MAG: hypothetical protein GY847_27015 [Proteobacteria bacterium]|nr:hypothetical protein [Pseudomonadota bacterium]
MKRLFLFGPVAVVLFVISGCLSPYETKLPEDPGNEAQLSKFLGDIQELPADEKKNINDFISRMRLAKQAEGYGYIIGMTARQALEKQLEWMKEKQDRESMEKEQEEKRIKDEEAKQLTDSAKRREMINICTVTLTKKKFLRANKKKLSRDRFSMSLKFDNKSDKDLSAIIGKLEFRDTADKLLKTIKIPIREPIKAKKTVTWSGELPCNKAKNEDAILAKTPLKKLKVTWVPETYHFADGTKIGIGI